MLTATALSAAGGLVGGGVGGLGKAFFTKTGVGLAKTAASQGSKELFKNGIFKPAIKAGWSGAQANMKTRSGLVWSFGGSAMGHHYPPVKKGPAPGGIAPVELVWAGAQVKMMWTHPFVPDPNISAIGTGFLVQPVGLPQTLKDWHAGPGSSVATSLSDNYQLFGEVEKQKDLPLKPTPPPPSASGLGGGGAVADRYTDALHSLQNAAQRYDSIQEKLPEKIEDVKAVSAQGQENIKELINRMNANVQSDGSKEAFSEMIANAFGSIHDTLDKSASHNQDIGRLIDALSKQFDEKLAKLGATMKQDLQESIAGLKASQSNPGLDPSQLPPGRPDVPPDPGVPGQPDDLGTLQDMSTGLSEPPGIDDIGAQRGIGSFPSPATPAVAPPAGFPSLGARSPDLDSAGSMMGSLMQMVMQQAMMRNLADNDLNNRRAQFAVPHPDDEVEPVGPPVVAAPVTAQPAMAAAPTSTSTSAPVEHATAPSTPGTSQPESGLHVRKPEADGSVTYTFPDGRTQKVSVTVAQALDAAIGNASGTDAQAAYAKTPAKWSDTKSIGNRVDPYQLMTGDVATWEHRTAVLVVFGTGDGGTLEVIANGNLQRFAAEMHDSAGEFGQFSGFAHPRDIEVTTPADGAGVPVTTGTPDPSVGAAMSGAAVLTG
ncbi:hypothetical protein [Nocardia sp. NPDC004260]